MSATEHENLSPEMATCWFGCSIPVAHNWLDDDLEPGVVTYLLA